VKRLAALSVLAMGMIGCLFSVGVAGATPGDDAKGPACANIVGGGFTFSESTATGSVTTEVAACSRLAYTVYVVSSTGGVTTVTSAPGTPIGDVVTFTVSGVSDDDGTVCIYVTSGPVQRVVFDRAPDADCEPANADPPGSTGYN
jgi:hypothetical protein